MSRLVRAAVAAAAVVLASSLAAVPARAEATFVVLQMNLCNSGMATTCYSNGRAVDEAAAKIHRYPPDLVTLQEVCRNDLHARSGWGKLPRAMVDVYGSGNVSVNFVPILNRYTNEPYRCLNGEEYGVAVMHHGNGREIHRGWYDNQDSTDELRAWTCTTVIKGRLTGCTTHMSTDPAIAMRQCHELMSILTSPWVMPEVVVAGDFNVRSEPGKPHNVQDCTPAHYDRRSDGGVQQVFFTRTIRWVDGASEPMRWTDHPLRHERFRV